MPTVLRSGPYRVYFFSHDPNEPPHVHVDHAPLRFARQLIAPLGGSWMKSCLTGASMTILLPVQRKEVSPDGGRRNAV